MRQERCSMGEVPRRGVLFLRGVRYSGGLPSAIQSVNGAYLSQDTSRPACVKLMFTYNLSRSELAFIDKCSGRRSKLSLAINSLSAS